MPDLLPLGRAVLAQQPFSRLLGTELVALEAGRCELALDIKPELMQQNGFVHGGVLSYLADNALTSAGATALAAPPVTSEMKINYLRPAIGQRLVARAQAVSAGRVQSVVRCDVFVVRDGVEKLCAVAQGTVVRLQPG
jgi:uncharacterized protein (TIGR00369 family)